MLIAIFSDVHGNLPALERFVEESKDADAYVCLGDVVNYGPWNDECLEIVHALPGIVLLEGNHERLFLGTDPIADEIPLVREFFNRSFASFSRADLITGLPREYALGRYLCTHTIDNRRVYADTAIEVVRDYLIGHTHHQFRIERGGHTIINCGSIGQDRKRLDMLSYALYNSATEAVELCRVAYRPDRLLQEMTSRDYPQPCLDYYYRKWAG
jgi:predicted phosphodiesterase